MHADQLSSLSTLLLRSFVPAIMSNDSSTAQQNKLAQLETAVQTSAALLAQQQAAADDAAQRVAAAKALLQQLDPQEQERLKVTDTALPELLARHQLAQEAVETTQKRHATNVRYLQVWQEKMKAATNLPPPS